MDQNQADQEKHGVKGNIVHPATMEIIISVHTRLRTATSISKDTKDSHIGQHLHYADTTKQ